MPEPNEPLPGGLPADMPPADVPPADGPPAMGDQDVMAGIQGLHNRMYQLERMLTLGERAAAFEHKFAFVPAWRRETRGEPRWHITLAVTAVLFLQWPLPGRLVLFRPTWILPALEVALLIMLVGLAPQMRLDRESNLLRALSMIATGLLSAANAWSVVRLVMGLIQGTLGNSAGPLLGSGAVIWLTNVIVFSWWYWELDRGGPAARAHATKQWPDFMFPQMSDPELAPKDWEPNYFDYAYLAFTNATAFSPTDTMPMTRWAKAAMTLQTIVSIVVVALVVSRAVNIFK
jgi:uncharacterized membrane protein